MSAYTESFLREVNQQIDVLRLLGMVGSATDKLQQSGNTIRSFCPIHGETVFRTLVIDTDTKSFRCMYGLCAGTDGGDMIQLYALVRKIPYDEAVIELVRQLGLNAALPVDDEYLKHHREVAENYVELGEFDEAEKIYRELLNLKPDYSDARDALISIYAEQGRKDEESRERFASTRQKIQLGDTAGALENARKLLEVRPDDAAIHRLVADCSIATGDKEAALWEYMAVADLTEASGDFEAAVEAYERADALELGLVDIIPHLLRAYVQAGRAEQGIEQIASKAERFAQKSDYKRAAEIYAAIVEHDEMRMDLRQRFVEIAALSEPDSELSEKVFATIRLFEERNEVDRAINSLQMLADESPLQVRAIDALCALYRRQKRDKEADAEFVRGIRLEFDSGARTPALERLQKFLAANEDNSTALEELAHLQGKSGNKSEALSTYRRLATLLADRKQYAAAIETCGRALRLDRDSLDIQERRARVLESWGHDNNDEMLEKASGAYEQLAESYNEATAGRRAAEFFEKAVELDARRRPGLLSKLATAQLRAGEKQAAGETAARAVELLAAEGNIEEAILESDHFLELIPEAVDLGMRSAELQVNVGQVSEAVAKMQSLADQCMAREQWDAAQRLIQRALDLNPRNTALLSDLARMHSRRGAEADYLNAMLRLATVHEQSRNHDEAVQTLEILAKREGSEVQAMARLAELNERISRPQEAQRWRLKLAKHYHKAKDYDSEAAALRDALSRAAEDEQILADVLRCDFARKDYTSAIVNARRLSAVQVASGRESAAISTLAQVLEHAPDNIEANRDMVDTLCRAGLRDEAVLRGSHLIDLLIDQQRFGEATAVYDQLVACDPENLTLKHDQIEFLKKAGRGEECLEKLIALAAQHRAKHQFAEAETILLEICADEQENVHVLEELAGLYEHKGDSGKLEEIFSSLGAAYRARSESDRAMNAFSRVLQINANNLPARRVRVELLRERGRHGDAVRELQILSDQLHRAGDDEEALGAEREAVELAPNDINARKRLIDSLVRLDLGEEAATEMERLAEVCIESQQSEAALEALNRLLKQSPDNLNARRMRAETYALLGEDSRALEEFRILSVSLTAAPAASMRGGSSTGQNGPDENGSLDIVKDYDFDHFVIGSNNNFAYATSLAVARAPARAYNPLLIYSDVGLGKTHLVNAIANFVLTKTPKTRIVYTSSEDFTADLVSAIQTNSIAQFRARYKSADLLIVDDIQFLAGKERAQEEFFHIFNALSHAKRQIVLTSDRPPKDIAHLESRLLSRFNAGVIVDIATPDLETRIAILNREIQEAGVDVDSSLVMMIAERIDTNVRELKGALMQLMAMRDTRGEIDADELRRILDTLYVRAS